MKKKFLDLLKDRVLLCDGAMGTMLYNKGIYLNSCFDELNLSNPELVKKIHQEYVDCDVDIIETNTFGANRYKLKKFGLEEKVKEINIAGAKIAREIAKDKIFVAGSIGPLGLKIEPWGPTSFEEAEEAFYEQASGLLEGGVDLFILETFSDVNEIHQAIKAVKRICDLPIIAQMTIEEDGNSLYGTSPEVFTKRLEEWGADVIGVNCSVGPAATLVCIERMAKVTDKPLSAMPNAGVPRNVEGRNIYLCSPDYLAEYAKRFILTGVKIVGGCCGTTPAHIRAVRRAIRALQPERRISPKIEIKEIEQRPEIKPIEKREKSQLARKLDEKKFIISVEIVPPRGFDPFPALEKAKWLKNIGIDCVNIPDGPRASARMSAMSLAVIIENKIQIETILHYTCRDRNLLGMQSDLLGAYAQGLKNILVITGDPPKIGDYPDATAVFDVDSIGLCNLVNALNRGFDLGGKVLKKPTGFHLGVGANPGAINLDYEIRRFEYKVEAGAEFAITQPVFDIELLENFLKRISHCRIPIIAGIWPLASLQNAEFMNNEVPGARVPPEIMDRMRKANEKGSEFARQEGIAIARETLFRIKDMIEGVQISPPFGRVELVTKIISVL
jgi:homocysteine S-methyltransferase